jgi:hypothetical protein
MIYTHLIVFYHDHINIRRKLITYICQICYSNLVLFAEYLEDLPISLFVQVSAEVARKSSKAQQLSYSNSLHRQFHDIPHTLYLCVLYDSQGKQRY